MAQFFVPGQIHDQYYSARFRADVEEEAERDASKPASETTLCKTVNGLIMKTNYQYTCSTRPIIEFEQNLHDLWHTVIVSASVTPVDDAGQDRLAAEILLAREMGLLSRTTAGTLEKNVTSEGDRSGRIYHTLLTTSGGTGTSTISGWIRSAGPTSSLSWLDLQRLELVMGRLVQ
jgi:hypothetical protein